LTPQTHARIGLGNASWIGTFEIGYTKIGSISLMPDNKHLFVSAKGAGYIIDARTHTLIEQVGTHVAFVWVDAANTLLMVDHNGMSFEMFGKSGRLWKTDTISAGISRDIDRRRLHRRRSEAGIGGEVGPFFGGCGDGGGAVRRWGFPVILKTYWAICHPEAAGAAERA
jgi:hypothetical protein